MSRIPSVALLHILLPEPSTISDNVVMLRYNRHLLSVSNSDDVKDVGAWISPKACIRNWSPSLCWDNEGMLVDSCILYNEANSQAVLINDVGKRCLYFS